MQTEAVRDEFDRDALLGFPLFRDFRRSEPFQAAFEKMYPAQLQDDILRKAEDNLKAEQSVGHVAAHGVD